MSAYFAAMKNLQRVSFLFTIFLLFFAALNLIEMLVFSSRRTVLTIREVVIAAVCALLAYWVFKKK